MKHNRQGRPRKGYLRANWKISLPAALIAEVDLSLLDPLTQKPKYASRARLTEALLRKWLQEARGDPITIRIPTLQELLEGPSDDNLPDLDEDSHEGESPRRILP